MEPVVANEQVSRPASPRGSPPQPPATLCRPYACRDQAIQPPDHFRSFHWGTDMADACTEGVDTGFVALGHVKVAILGVIQGITELLPISSTAHMRIVPALLGWQDPGSAFSAAMQLAALAAVVSYFWSDVRLLVFGSVGAAVRGDFRNPALKMVLWILGATIPILVAGLLLEKRLNACGSPLRGIFVIGLACIAMAVLLALAEI